MATSTLPAAPAAYVPPKGRKFQLYLTIDGYPYGVRPVLADPFLARRAFQLTKPDGRTYDVAQTRFGASCDCPDFIYRRDGLDPLGCKHVRALVSCGLIEREGPPPPPSGPRPAPEDAPAGVLRGPSLMIRSIPTKISDRTDPPTTTRIPLDPIHGDR